MVRSDGMLPVMPTTMLTFCLVANLVAQMAFPAVLPAASAAWQLSASQAGWIGGIYFAGYAAAVPLLAGATDRFDGRWIVIGSSLLGAGASCAFALLADGFWPALLLRGLGGVAIAGVHMPGLVLLTQHATPARRDRSVAIYTSSYALGSASSFLVAGVVEAAFGWRAVFVASGIAPLLAAAAVATLAPAPRTAAPTSFGFTSVFRNRPFLAYVAAFAGNTWEVFGIRVWFVACLAWTLRLPGNAVDLPNLALVAGVAALASVPASIAVAEVAARHCRVRVIAITCLVSVAVCLGLALTAGGSIWLVLPLLVALQITSFADVGALGAGAVALADPARRGASLAVYAAAGFTTGFAGPVAVGLGLDAFGGESAAGWAAAFLIMALGSSVAAGAVWSSRRARPSPSAR
jgi:MFS family permease